MNPLMLCLLVAYALVAALVYFKFCWRRPGIDLEEQLWGCLLWPLLVLAAAVFIALLAAHAKDLDDELAKHPAPHV